jgi:hypothetical protein
MNNTECPPALFPVYYDISLYSTKVNNKLKDIKHGKVNADTFTFPSKNTSDLWRNIPVFFHYPQTRRFMEK